MVKTGIKRTLFLTICAAMLGTAGCAAKNVSKTQSVPENTSAAAPETIPETAPEETQTQAVVELPKLSEEERQLLEQLTQWMQEDEWAQAARTMLEQGDALSRLYYETLAGEPYRFADGELCEELSGDGLVLSGASTLFWGSFGENGPEGQCTALQAVNLDAPRYDYAAGNWEKGEMEGAGETGYRYFESVPESEPAKVCRGGTFSKNQMEGAVVCQNTAADETVTTWTIQVEHGVVVTDERWTRSEETGALQLIADDNPMYAYEIAPGEEGEEKFSNFLIWN